MIVSSNHGQTERDLSWLDFGYLRALSDDGKTILFEEESGADPNYRVFVRSTDGSPAVPIGEGYGLAMSRDKNWVLAEKITEPVREIWLLPVGPGEARRMSPANLQPEIAARFLSDGKRFVYVAREKGRARRTWLQDVSGASPRPITPEGTFAWIVSGDDKWLITGQPAGINAVNGAALISMDHGNPEKIQGLKSEETVLGWTDDGQLYVGSPANTSRIAVHIEKLNPHTGGRTAWGDLAVPPIGGVLVDPPIIAPDGASYAFDYNLRLSDLYTVSGVR